MISGLFLPAWLDKIRLECGISKEVLDQFIADVQLNPHFTSNEFHADLYNHVKRYKQHESNLPLAVKNYFNKPDNHYLLLTCCLGNIGFANFTLPTDQIVHCMYAAIFAGSNILASHLINELYPREFKNHVRGLTTADMDWNDVATEGKNIELVKWIISNSSKVSADFRTHWTCGGFNQLVKDNYLMTRVLRSTVEEREYDHERNRTLLGNENHEPAVAECQLLLQQMIKTIQTGSAYYDAYFYAAYYKSPVTCLHKIIDYVSSINDPKQIAKLVEGFGKIMNALQSGMDHSKFFSTVGSQVYPSFTQRHFLDTVTVRLSKIDIISMKSRLQSYAQSIPHDDVELVKCVDNMIQSLSQQQGKLLDEYKKYIHEAPQSGPET